MPAWRSNRSMNPTALLAILFSLLAASGLLAGPKIFGSTKFQFTTGNASVTFGCGGINNPSKENATGTVMVRLWALNAPYQGGGIRGFQLGSVKKDALKTGYSYTDVKNTAKYAKPPAGSYYVNLVLSELDEGEYRIVSHLAGSTRIVFK